MQTSKRDPAWGFARLWGDGTPQHQQGTAPELSHSAPRPAPGTTTSFLTIPRAVCSGLVLRSGPRDAGTEPKGPCGKHRSISLAIIQPQRWGEVSERCWAEAGWLMSGPVLRGAPRCITKLCHGGTGHRLSSRAPSTAGPSASGVWGTHA